MNQEWLLEKQSETCCGLTCNGNPIFEGTYPGCVIKFLELASATDTFRESGSKVELSYKLVQRNYDCWLWPDEVENET